MIYWQPNTVLRRLDAKKCAQDRPRLLILFFDIVHHLPEAVEYIVRLQLRDTIGIMALAVVLYVLSLIHISEPTRRP